MFFLVKRNFLESSSLLSCAGAFTFILIHYTTNISPITGIWFPVYVLGLFFVCLYLSFKFIQYALHMNKPLKYDLDVILEEYPYLTAITELIPKRRKKSRVSECREYDTDELSVISTVLERKLVSSWYMPYISQEIGFPFACKQMLDQMIGKTFQICNKIEIKDVYVDITTVLTSHLNEYQRAQRRHENAPTIRVENFYKTSHPIFNVTNKLQPADHCTNLLRIAFKELIPWELWDTPHSELLVRILSKKLDNFIDSTLADPRWLNDKLLTILQGKQETTVSEEKKEPEKAASPEEVPKDKRPEPVNMVTEPPPAVVKGTATTQVVPEEPKVQTEVEKIESIVEEVPVTSSAPVDIKTSPILRQRRGRQGRNEVKIYDRIIEGSVKTWETDIDLQCISLGQDLLASLDGEITLSRLWGHDNDGSPNPPRGKSPQPLWFGEEETIEVDPLDSNIFKDQQTKKEQSPKPADALLKDLQSTVREAKTKIGDLQVSHTLALDVPRKQNSSDEAAGMMEGLLDFGIAGLKKGLRFTGLSDDSDKSPSHRSPPAEPRPHPAEHREPHVKENNNGHRDDNNVPPLVKQHRVTSQDIVPSLPRAVPRAEGVPAPLPDSLSLLPDSPEPEYEEAADLSTSIAKLRCLLQQRAETSPRAESAQEAWWAGAEEARGQSRHRPLDAATLADEYDMNMDRNSSPSQTSNNMQRLDKLFQRTVTGVFNSLKTAVGAEGEQPTRTLHDWTYVATAIDLNACGAVSRLVGSRRAAQVEAALDSLAQLGAAPPPQHHHPLDYEEWCSACGAGWCGTCALLAAAGLVRSHVAHRLATMLIADLGEALIDAWLADLATWLRGQVFVIFEQLQKDSDYFQPKENLRPFNLDETCAVLMEKMPGLMFAFGEENLSPAVRMLVSSFSHKQINCDVIYRVLDLLVAHFKKSAALRNPSFDI